MTPENLLSLIVYLLVGGVVGFLILIAGTVIIAFLTWKQNLPRRKP